MDTEDQSTMSCVYNSTGHKLLFPDIVKAENSRVFDSRGTSYLDLESGVWCTPLGHAHPRISRVIAEQAGRIIHTGYCYLNPLVDSIAEKILGITGIGAGKCVFPSSGSEAVEYSIKLVQTVSEKPFFLTMKNCYLSAYGVSGERSESQWIHFDWMKGEGPDTIDYSRIAAFVFEPGSSLGLVHFPPRDVVQAIAKGVREAGGLVIVNEVTTGTGRTGKWFGFQHYDLVPDVVAMGKGLGNGYPVSCVAISERVFTCGDTSEFHYGQSHQNDPLGAAIAGEVIDVIAEEGLLQRARDLGDYLIGRLEFLKELHGLIKEVRGRGLMLAIEFGEIPGHSVATIVFQKLLEKNIILVKRPGHEVLRVDPPLTIPRTDLDYFLESLESILATVRTELDGASKAVTP